MVVAGCSVGATAWTHCTSARRDRVDAEAIAGVQSRSWQAAYLGMLPNEVLLGFGQAQGVTFWQRILERGDADDLVLVAELEGEVVGFVSCGPIRDRIPGYSGEFYALYVPPEAQGCGIGTP